MEIHIPDYLLESILRHYNALANAYRNDGNLKAVNAKRMSEKEIGRAMKLIEKQKK